MTEVASLHVASRAVLPWTGFFFLKIESELIFTIVISNLFKTGVRMRLTSSVKELEAILQKLIKIDHFINLE